MSLYCAYFILTIDLIRRSSMKIIGITGSMASGKSSLTHRAKLNAHIPVWDADKQIHVLYSQTKIQNQILMAFPRCQTQDRLDKTALRKMVSSDPHHLRTLEGILYPALAVNRHEFLARHARSRAPIVILDIPLLFEKNMEALCDVTVLVKSPGWLLEQRILKRPQMTQGLMKSLLSAQLSQEEKMQRADFVVDSGLGHHHTWIQFLTILEQLGL